MRLHQKCQQLANQDYPTGRISGQLYRGQRHTNKAHNLMCVCACVDAYLCLLRIPESNRDPTDGELMLRPQKHPKQPDNWHLASALKKGSNKQNRSREERKFDGQLPNERVVNSVGSYTS